MRTWFHLQKAPPTHLGNLSDGPGGVLNVLALPIGAWRHAYRGPEPPREVALVGKAGFGRDHGRRPAETQQLGGMADAHLSLECVRRKAERPAEDAIEVIRREASQPR